jgi:hypothetical protein
MIIGLGSSIWVEIDGSAPRGEKIWWHLNRFRWKISDGLCVLKQKSADQISKWRMEYQYAVIVTRSETVIQRFTNIQF